MSLVLADTSVWIDHLRGSHSRLSEVLEADRVVTHPGIIAELALGNLSQRTAFLSNLQNLPHALVAAEAELLTLIEGHRLHGRGIGYLDTHLLASARLTPDVLLWTRDKRLRVAAQDLGVNFSPE